ncbi:Mur ligase family protein [Macrococcus armenti]|uniref:Mur ligase family protein n=1 Tax=Macrococcus armenti TaxID=2875764 RepID=UPI001CCF3005|nr:Mur ligase family protein [Macrococcus armenti]UBH15211.1 glutamate ligase [Macrococcus armenti]UBH17571.1 glutamate ligase [Macrococcus armenti]UBH19837.1 glutamate ligase [Macrococcus armenti]
MLTINEINHIISGDLKDAYGKENNPINDFETMYRFVSNQETAYISANPETWWRQLGRDKSAPHGNYFIDKENPNIGLIITEIYIPDLKYKTPQIIVEDTVDSLKKLAIHIRNEYKNPIISITGSMGKSSTRILLRTMLNGYTALQNRGNNNIRAAIYANMCKLIKNQQFAILETSLNAINHRGNSAIDLKPDIAVVTGIGAAHFSTFKSIKDIALLKSRIFDGLSENGIAIINKDTLYSELLIEKAYNNTKKVFTYSMTDDSADLTIQHIEYLKGKTLVKAVIDETEYEYEIHTISEGMVSNSLAVIVCLHILNIDFHPEYFQNFKPFIRVLNMKEVKTPTHTLTLLDDTHNASLPAMVNAIKAFNTQAKYFSGNKIIAIGKINDLGHKSKEVHEELIPILENSKADYILCLDDELGSVVKKIKNKNITWYPNSDLLKEDLKYLLNEDSFVLLKSSAGGTEFPKIARELPDELKKYPKSKSTLPLFNYMSSKGKSYLIIDNDSNDVIEQQNILNSQTIEGIGPLINFIYSSDFPTDNIKVKMKNWASNDSQYYEGYETDLQSLIKMMARSPHPSLTYELSSILFPKSGQRDSYQNAIISELQLNNSVAINLTGRFMRKQRQSFSVNDLLKIYKVYKFELFKYSNSFIIGRTYYSGFIRGESRTILFTSFKNLSEVKNILAQYDCEVNYED